MRLIIHLLKPSLAPHPSSGNVGGRGTDGEWGKETDIAGTPSEREIERINYGQNLLYYANKMKIQVNSLYLQLL